MEPITTTILIIAAASALGLTATGCVSNDTSQDDHRRRDAGDADGPPPDGPQSIDAGDASAVDGNGVDMACVQPRNGINDDYAKTIFSPLCVAEDLDIIGEKIFGVSGYPLNKVFACQIHSDPMETTICTGAFSIDTASQPLDGGAPSPNKPQQLVDLGDGQLLVTYKTEGSHPNNFVVIDNSTYALIQHIALGAMQYMNGSSVITVMPRPSDAPVFLNDHLFIATENYNADTQKYERGTVVVIKRDELDPNKFDLENVSLFFTNGRNPTAIAAKDDHTIVILNANGPASTIPTPAGPGEVPGASIDVVDVSQPANPVFLHNIPIGDVELKKLPNLALTADKTMAIVGSDTLPRTIYKVDLSGQNPLQSAKLLNTAGSIIVSIAISQGAPQKALVSLSDGNLYVVDLEAMADVGAGVYLGRSPGPSAISSDGRYLYQSVLQANCEEFPEFRIIAIDTTTALP